MTALSERIDGEGAMPIIDSQRIPVSALQIGMYVSGIDRAWSDTPFPLQGFHIESRDQLEAVKRYCKHVDVDTLKSRARIDPRVLHEARQDISNRFMVRQEPSRDILNARIRPLQNNKPYLISSPLKQEIKSARKIHHKLQTRITAVLASMVDDGKLAIDQLRPLAGELVESVIRNPDAFAYLTQMESHHQNLLNYCVRVATWATLTARHLNIKRDALYDLAVAALLCKIGYTTLAPEISEIRGSAPEHVDTLRKHSLLTGIEMLQTGTDFSSRVAKAVAHHLERYDGSGFPNGLQGRETPFLAQIVGLADHYENLISYDYRDHPLGSAEAIRQLNSERDVLFERCLVGEFIQSIGLYPTGSLVRLNRDRIALVVSQTPGARLRPTVLVLEGKRRAWPFLGKRLIDLTLSEGDRIEASLPTLPRESAHRQKTYFRRAFGLA